MRIALAGFGQEGKASYDYWNTAGNQLAIADERDAVTGLPDDAETILGAGAFSRLSEFDLVIRSPGVNPSKLPYSKTVWSATNEFFEKCPAPIIGVTGTKGKGTTCSFIASILRASGRTVHLLGNIGTPALSELAGIEATDLVVYELSSFQLWDVKKSPHVAVVLMIEPDHLDVHDDMADYISAKANIARYQQSTDVLVYNSQNEISRSIAEESPAEKIEFPFELGKLSESIRIPGEHNQHNASAAISAVSKYVTDKKVIEAGLQSFQGLPHRLKFVAEKEGVSYFDDSIATTPGSAIAALASFESPTVIILGGYDKGAEYEELIESCRRSGATVVAIGSNGSRIARLCREAGVSHIEETGDMLAIVGKAHDIAQPGSVVVLSPAAASFDMFESYADRGEQFEAAVHSLKG